MDDGRWRRDEGRGRMEEGRELMLDAGYSILDFGCSPVRNAGRSNGAGGEKKWWILQL